MIKELVAKFDEIQIFAGKSFDTEGALMFMYNYEGEENPTCLFLAHGLKEEKF